MIMVSTVFAQEINLLINDIFIYPEMAPRQENGTTLVPLRVVSENLGALVEWDGATQSITIVQDATEIKLKIGDKKVWVNGNIKELAVAPRSIEGTTMIPIRFISENLDCSVDWNSENKIITISSSGRVERLPVPLNQSQTDIVLINEGDFSRILMEEYGFSLAIPDSWDGYFTIKEGNWAFDSERTIDFTFVYDNMEISNIFSIIISKDSDEIDEDYGGGMWQYLGTGGGMAYASSHIMEMPPILELDQYRAASEILKQMVNDDLPKILKTFKLEKGNQY